MIPTIRRLRPDVASVVVAALLPASAAAQVTTVPLTPDAWVATDSIRFLSYQGRPSFYIDRGVALARGAAMENGTLELDVAASDTTNFIGVAFQAANPRFSNVVFLRFGASCTEEAVQYGPAFNSLGVAWQVYHGEGANAVADLGRNAGPISRSSSTARWPGSSSTPRRRRPWSFRAW